MLMKVSKGIITLVLCVVILKSHAQNGVMSAGGNATSAGGTVSFSIGQIDFIAVTSNTGSVSQGVQQTYVSTPLPVTLLNFKVTKKEKSALLNWETATEINSNKFIIQRSIDGITFSDLNEILAAGASTTLRKYAVEDRQPLQKWNYYRIKLLDKDGSFIYSKTGTVNFTVSDNIAIVYPNPTKNYIILRIPYADFKPFSYQLLDTRGHMLLQNTITNSETNIVISKLSAGTYFLKIYNQGTKEIKTFNIIKTN